MHLAGDGGLGRAGSPPSARAPTRSRSAAGPGAAPRRPRTAARRPRRPPTAPARPRSPRTRRSPGATWQTFAHSISVTASESAAPSSRTPKAGGRLAQQRQLRLHQPRRPPADHPRPEVGELAQRRRVERGRAHRLGAAAERAQPPAQLPRRADGEGEREHVRRVDHPGRDRVGDAVRDRPGLAGARARQHADRPPAGQRYLALLGVERGEQVIGVHPSYGAACRRQARGPRGKARPGESCCTAPKTPQNRRLGQQTTRRPPCR